MLDKTMVFSLGGNRDDEIKNALTTVYDALQKKGYNPINQIVGYIMSEDPTYITTYNNARNIISKIDRHELLETLVKSYLNDQKGLNTLAEKEFSTYKGKPLVRCGDEIYYGSMDERFVIRMQIKSKKQENSMEMADKVAIQLLCTDPDLSPRKQLVKSSEKNGLFLALDIADVWLERALKS